MALAALTDQASDDRDEAASPLARGYGWRARHPLDPVNMRNLPDRGYGKSTLFRILLTNACSFSCSYCPMRAGREIPRHAIAPEELASYFLTAWKQGWVQGLFITTGIPKSPRYAMDRLIELVEILRFRHKYAGYIHAKAVSGGEEAQIERLALLCERVSFNLEAACQATLDRVAPEKSLEAGLSVLSRLRRTARETGASRLPGDPRPPGAAMKAGATAQFVAGIGSESDQEILGLSHRLWKERALHHPHFAAFRPIENTPLENAPETPSVREQRLYQADYLLRLYGFAPEEIPYRPDGNLAHGTDPKLAAALQNPGRFPVEISTAPREMLLRVPGLGPKTVERLLSIRRGAASLDLAGLRRLGAVISRAAGLVSWKGKLLGDRAYQAQLFEPEDFPAASQVYSFSPGTFR
ncbi:MAG TPA: radical SAM protein [Thermoanaerobaculia bacterium]